MPQHSNSSRLVLLAFASVYLFWGSTYLAIHIAGEHLPVPVVSGTRSLITCLLIVAISLLRGKSLRVSRKEAPRLVLVGLLFMSANNMLLTWGETMVPTGFASLVVSTMPIMVALMETALPGGETLNRRGWAGTLLATAGVAVLVYPSLRAPHGAAALAGYSRPVLGMTLCLLAAFAFAIGSVLSRRFHFQTDTFVATGWEIGAAAIFNLSLATVTGGFRHAHWTAHGLIAIVYLSIFGSLFGLVAFTYLLQNVAVTKVSTYAFVNPVIAVLLGGLVLHERLAGTQIAGMAVIVGAVAMVIYSRVQRVGASPAGDSLQTTKV